MSRKELKILDSVTLYFVSGFRRNYNNRLLKLAPMKGKGQNSMEDVSFLEDNVSVVENYFEVSDGVQLKVFDFIPPGYTQQTPVIVFVAGWISLLQGWKSVLKVITKEYRTLYIETREKKSAQLPSGKTIHFSIDRMSLDVEEILAGTISDQQHFYFLGSSLGSTIILHYLSMTRKHPKESFLISPISEFPFPMWLLFVINFIPAGFYAAIKPVLKWYLKYFHLDRKNEPEQVKKYEGTIEAAEPGRLKANAYAIKDYNLWNRLEKIHTSVILIGAETDKLHGIDSLKKMVSRMPQAGLEMMKSNKETHSEVAGSFVVDRIRLG